MRLLLLLPLLLLGCVRETELTGLWKAEDPDRDGVSPTLVEPSDGLQSAEAPIDTDVGFGDDTDDTDLPPFEFDTDQGVPPDDTFPDPDPTPPPVDTDVEDSGEPLVPEDLLPAPVDPVPYIAPVPDRHGFFGDLDWPESGDFDAVGRAFYVGSLLDGRVLRLNLDGSEEVWYQNTGVSAKTWGVKVDSVNRRIYACAEVLDATPSLWYTWVINADTGTLIRSISMGDSGTRAQCRDFAVASDGKVYVTDQRNPWVHEIDPATWSVDIWANDSRMNGVVWGMDGLAFSEDEQHLLVNVAKPAKLFRIERANPANVNEVPLSGATGWGLRANDGIDGMWMYGGHLWISANNHVLQIVPDAPDWSSGRRWVWLPPEGGVTGFIEAEQDLYVICGDRTNYGLANPDRPIHLVRVLTPLPPTPDAALNQPPDPPPPPVF